MRGYTIDGSIDLLEKDVEQLKRSGGGGGASSWNNLTGKPFQSLGEEFRALDRALSITEISSDKISLPDSEAYQWPDVSSAIEALAEDSNHFSDDIAELENSKQDSLTAGTGISITDNVISASAGAEVIPMGSFIIANSGIDIRGSSCVVKIGNIIFAHLVVSKASNFTTAQSIIGKIVTRYRPNVNVQAYGMMANENYNTSSTTAYITIPTNGDIEVWGNDSYKNVKFDVMYVIGGA